MRNIKRYSKYIIAGTLVLFTLLSFICFKSAGASESGNIVSSKEKKTESEKEAYYYVDIKGAVKEPGVYKLKENSRVIDVINASGGLSDNADTSILNLSKKITDEMLIIVYTSDEINAYKSNSINSTSKISEKIESSKTTIDENNDAEIKTNAKTNSDLININTASKDILLNLTGIGSSKAEKIIKYREENGNFTKIEDIKNVSGIGDAIFEKIKDKITVK